MREPGWGAPSSFRIESVASKLLRIEDTSWNFESYSFKINPVILYYHVGYPQVFKWVDNSCHIRGWSRNVYLGNFHSWHPYNHTLKTAIIMSEGGPEILQLYIWVISICDIHITVLEQTAINKSEGGPEICYDCVWHLPCMFIFRRNSPNVSLLVVRSLYDYQAVFAVSCLHCTCDSSWCSVQGVEFVSWVLRGSPWIVTKFRTLRTRGRVV